MFAPNPVTHDLWVDAEVMLKSGETLTYQYPRNILETYPQRFIKERGESIWDALPILAIYMGHRKICSTTRYLTVLNAKHRQDLLDFLISNQEIL